MAGNGKNYNSIVNDWLEDDQLMLLECWSRDKYTFEDIANKIGISTTVLRRWRDKYPEIDAALKKGREIVDYKVENALYKSAVGYRTKEVKIISELNLVTGELQEVRKEVTIKEQAPNVVAAKTWLTNRLPEKWKNNRDQLLELDEDDQNINITITRAETKQGKNNNDNSEEQQEEEETIDATGMTNEEIDLEWQEEINNSVTIQRNKEYYEEKKNKEKEQKQRTVNERTNKPVSQRVQKNKGKVKALSQKEIDALWE